MRQLEPRVVQLAQKRHREVQAGWVHEAYAWQRVRKVTGDRHEGGLCRRAQLNGDERSGHGEATYAGRQNNCSV